jgi:hypothetical protein
MKLYLLITLLLLTKPIFAEETKKYDELITKSGKKYTSVIVLQKTDSKISITHQNGAASIPYEELPDNIIKELGGFDAKAAVIEREKEAILQEKIAVAERDEIKVKEANERRFKKLIELVKIQVELKAKSNSKDLEKINAVIAKYNSIYSDLKKFPDATDEQIDDWIECIINQKLKVGMPSLLILHSWGSPHKINQNSHAPDEWIYRRLNNSFTYLYVEDGKLKKYSEF